MIMLYMNGQSSKKLLVRIMIKRFFIKINQKLKIMKLDEISA
jgi:hypothetical protein